jgi:Histidine kinase
MNASATSANPWTQRGQRLAAAVVRAFHRYANWLVGISWVRFAVLALVLIIAANILQGMPPFSWSVTETIEDVGGKSSSDSAKPPKPPKPAREPREPRVAAVPAEPAKPAEPVIRIERPASAASGASSGGIDISIDSRGIRVSPKKPAGAASAAAAGEPVVRARIGDKELQITLPPGADTEEVRTAVREALEDAAGGLRDAATAQREAMESLREANAEAQRAAAEARAEAEAALAELRANLPGSGSGRGTVQRTRRYHWGDFLPELALLWVLGSAVIKITYKGRLQAEVKAAQATETAEAESLRRQVVEARMAAMQAQVEPHFLFNTLASIDHLIETDPARASQMQKNLIALLRASMPSMREAQDGRDRDLGRELAVIRPYLEILKVRMEERLSTHIDVPEGLHSAEFPPMMIQTLVENAIKHGLEPKADGGSLLVKAEIVHGRLQVTVADTGLGFGRAATAGTGVGLANIRERLQLLYGNRASLTITENQPSGTVVTIGVPYKTLDGSSQGAAA